MTIMRKSRVTQAVAAAVFAAGLSMVGTTPVAAAIANNPEGIGHTLLYPYYTTKNDFSTLVHLVNTSSVHTVVAKVRLREYQNSEDVLDFTVVLSPRDVFSGYIKQGESGPVFVKTDNSCTSPNVGGKKAEIAFSGGNLSTSHTGHIEVITMATINNAEAIGRMAPFSGAASVKNAAGTLVQGALHDSSGSPANCAAVDNLFTSANIGNLQDSVARLAPVVGPTRIGDFLNGHYSLLNTKGGYAGGGRPTVLADDGVVPNKVNGVFNPCYEGAGVDVDANPPAAGAYNYGNVGHLLCGQYPQHYFVPNIGNLNGVDGTKYVATNPARFNQIEDAIANNNNAPNVQNEWSANKANGVASEMVFTLPLKHIYNDRNPMSSADIGADSADVFAGGDANAACPLAGGCDWDDTDSALRPGNPLFGDVDGCVNYSRRLVDREEANTTPGTSASGPIAASIATRICNETQVFSFGGGVTKPAGATAEVDTSSLAQQFGWFNMTFSAQDGSTLSQAVANTGFGFWKRDFGNPSTAFGQIINNTRN